MNTEATREVFWNLSHPANAVVMYLFFAVSLVIFGYGLYSRFQFWKAGESRLTPSFPSIAELFTGFVELASQRRTSRAKPAGTYHKLVLLGFLSLLAITTAVFLDYDLGIPVFRGNSYLFLTLFADVFGAVFFFALLMFLKRRSDSTNTHLTTSPGDRYFIYALLLMLVQGFLLEALRIASIEDPWAVWSPVGLLLSYIFWPLELQAKEVLHFGIWWFHAITFFFAFAITPYTKAFHIISSSFCLITSKPSSATPVSHQGDVQQMFEQALESGDENISFGVRSLSDTTWRHRLEFDGCTACGRCQEVCPAWLSGKSLSPKLLMVAMKRYSDRLSGDAVDVKIREALSSDYESKDKREEAYFKPLDGLTSSDSKICGDLIDEDVFWSCTTCRACVEACPVGINHVDFIVDVRRSETLIEAATPREAQTMLRILETKSSPFVTADERLSWTDGIKVPILEEGDEVEILYWVGCISNSDKRKQSIARSIAKILNESGRSWGILGKHECCTGDPARRLGDEMQFQAFCNQNVETFGKYKFERILANCPHCLNSLGNEYSYLRDLQVVHHTELIKELIETGEIRVDKNISSEVTYHDPCYLGRYSSVINEPREVLVQIGGVTREMESTGRSGLCCGAGGGHFWMDDKTGERVNVMRVEQALATKADSLVTSCPFCLHMLEDATKLIDGGEELEVRDIAELVSERLETFGSDKQS